MEHLERYGSNTSPVPKYSAMWYCLMCMRAFCDGDRKLAEQYYDRGMEVMKITGSVDVPPTMNELYQVITKITTETEKT